MPDTETVLDNDANKLAQNAYSDEALKELVDAGVFCGRRKSKTHPRMKQFIFGNRSGIEIIDLQKTLAQLQRATEFLKERVAAGATVLFVGTQPAAEDGVKEAAEKLNFPWVVNRWLGGTLTNFKIIQKRIEYFKKLKADRESGALLKYTKKERVGIEGELKRLQELWGGLEGLNGRPDVLVVVDANLHHIAIHEARMLGIPVVALINTDSDPESVEYPVVGNNKSRKSTEWFLGALTVVMLEGKASAKSVLETAAATETKEAGANLK